MQHITVLPEADSYRLALDTCPKPEMGEQDVLIKVAAAGINRADLYQAEGSYAPPEGVSDILGLEVSGEVVEIGAAVKTLSVGDKVCALVSGGGYAEYVATAEWRVLPIPEGLDFIQAAAIPETFFTVYLDLFELARLKPGETLLVQGGASGIGTTAIQLAGALGSKVIVTAGSDDKCMFCETLGADKAINYKTEDYVDSVKQITDEQGVDVVLDMVGGSYFQRNLKVLKPRGRMISIAFIESAKAEVNFAPLLMKNLTWIGATLRSRSEEEIYDLAQSLRTIVWPMLASGKIKPIIDSTFPFDQAQSAHTRMRNFEHTGKIVLVK